jgi:hypothetical protein
MKAKALIFFEGEELPDKDLEYWDISTSTFSLMGSETNDSFDVYVSHDIFDPDARANDDDYPSTTLYELAKNWIRDGIGEDEQGKITIAFDMGDRLKAVIDLAVRAVRESEDA